MPTVYDYLINYRRNSRLIVDNFIRLTCPISPRFARSNLRSFASAISFDFTKNFVDYSSKRFSQCRRKYHTEEKSRKFISALLVDPSQNSLKKTKFFISNFVFIRNRVNIFCFSFTLSSFVIMIIKSKFLFVNFTVFSFLSR